MPYIKGVLLEEYCRMAENLKDYLSKPSTPQREEAIASLRVDMAFIENAFKGNGQDIAKEITKSQIAEADHRRPGWKSQHP